MILVLSVIGVIRVRCWRLHSKRLITIYNMIWYIGSRNQGYRLQMLRAIWVIRVMIHKGYQLCGVRD
jgi:hypothetical protein